MYLVYTAMCMMNTYMYLALCTCRSHLRTEVEVLTGKLERANLAKSMADSKLSELDRYKAMIELEMNEILARHKTAMTEKMARAVQVRNWTERGRREGRRGGSGGGEKREGLEERKEEGKGRGGRGKEGRTGGEKEGGKFISLLSLIFFTQIEEHLMFTETKLDEKNRENEVLSFDLDEARRSKQTPLTLFSLALVNTYCLVACMIGLRL